MSDSDERMSEEEEASEEVKAPRGKGRAKASKPRAKAAKKRRARSSSEEESESEEADNDAMEEDEERAKMPLKKRMALASGGARGAAAPSSSEEEEAAAGEGSQSEDDPYGSDYMGDDADRAWLATMNELDRELVIAERAERRLDAKQRRELREEMRAREAKKRGKAPPRGRAPTADKEAKRAALQELAARRAGDKGAAREAASRRRAEDVKRRAEARAAASESRSATDEEADAGEEDEDDEDEAPATMAELQRLVLPRLQLEKWVDKPFFDATLPGCFVRIATGNGSDGKGRYRLAEVAAVLLGEHRGRELRSYEFGPGGRRTGRWLLLRHGVHEQAFKMSLVSNAPPEDGEVDHWAQAAKAAMRRPLTRTQLATREAALAAAHAFRYTSADVARAVEAKRAAGHAPRNVALEKEQLNMRLEVAVQAGDAEEVEGLRAQISAIDAQLEAVLPRGAAAMDKINKRNAVANVAILDAAGREAAAAALRGSASNAGDPFSRRPTRVTNYWQTGKKQAAEDTPAPKAPEPTPAPEPADDLAKALAEEDAAAAAELDTDALRSAPGDERERKRAAEHAARWQPFDLSKLTAPRRIPVLRHWRGGLGGAEEAIRAGKTLITVQEYYARRGAGR